MKTNKLIIAFTLLMFGFTINTFAQSSDDDDCVKKGKIIIDGFYGYPYLFGSYIKQVVADNNSGNADNLKVFNLNHLGARAEYMLTDMIGIGLEYTYAMVRANYDETVNVFNSNTQTNVLQINSYNAGIIKQRILAKINIHFATSKHLDPYATFGLGYKSSRVYSTNPNDAIDVSDLNNSILNAFPVAFRAGIGLRYYFAKNIGVGAEVGLGGPIVQAGLSIKF